MKRALRPISIGALRIVEKNREHDRPRQYYEYGAFQTGKAVIQVWASNSGSEQIVNLRLMALELLTGQQQRIFSGDVTLLANAATEVWSGSLAPSCKGTGNTVVHAVITDATGAVTRYDDWPQPYKFLDLPDPGIVGEICDGVLYLRSRYAAKALWLDVEGPSEGVEWDQNSVGSDRVTPIDEVRLTCTLESHMKWRCEAQREKSSHTVASGGKSHEG